MCIRVPNWGDWGNEEKGTARKHKCCRWKRKKKRDRRNKDLCTQDSLSLQHQGDTGNTDKDDMNVVCTSLIVCSALPRRMFLPSLRHFYTHVTAGP